MTTKELVEMTINELRTIMVPADLLDQMGPPLSRSLSNLRILHQAIDQAEKEQTHKEEAEPEFEVVEAEELPEDNAEVIELTE